MASTDKPDTETAATKEAAPPAVRRRVNLFVVDVVLRGLLFASAVTSVVVMVTSNQTITSGLRGVPPGLPVPAKFRHSPAFIYFVAALSVAGLYSLITALASIAVILKPNFSAKFLLHFALFDVLIFGLVASATGTAGGVAYIGLKGNKHVQWNKVCYAFDKFCQHIGGALAVSLFASVVLVLLIWLSIFSIHCRIPK